MDNELNTPEENLNDAQENLQNVPGTNEPSPLTSDDLDSVEDIQLVQPEADTGAVGELARFETQTDQFTKEIETETEVARGQEETSFQALLDTIAEAPGTREVTAREEDRVGLSGIKSELKGINDQLRQEQQALRRKIEATQTEAGLTKGQVNQRVEEMQRVSYRKQADLAVIQQSIQGRFDSAKEIADRAIAIESERQQRKLDILGMNYQRNKSLFDKAEQRSFEVRLADRQRKIQQEAEAKRNIYEIGMQAAKFGANPSQVQGILSATDPRIALKNASSFLGREFNMQMQAHSMDMRLKSAQLARTQLEMSLIGQPTEEELEAEREAMRTAEGAVPVLDRKITLLDGLMKHNAMDSVVGPNPLSRAPQTLSGRLGRFALGGLPALQGAVDQFTGADDDFIAGVEQMISQEFLDSLIAVKERGGTFGALQKAEQDALTQAATKIGFWRVESGSGEDAKVIGYNANEKDFMKELQTIQNIAKLARQRAAGNLTTPDEENQISEYYQQPDLLDEATIQSFYK